MNEIINCLEESGPTKAVRLPDGRLVTASLAKELGYVFINGKLVNERQTD